VSPSSSSLSASYALALQAARQAAGHQDFPAGTLYVVATPIGNLADISLRALQVLQLVDVMACEDTRHTRQLLQAYGLDRPGLVLSALHQHNEAEATQALVELLALGQRVACVSDAGTPAISDPGARLVAAVQSAGLRVMPLPGASSVTTLLSASGLSEDSGFVFMGFVPHKGAARDQALHALAQETRAVVLLEAPHRIERLAAGLSALGLRRVTVGRELTKQFEEIVTLAAQDLPSWLRASDERRRGEFVLTVHAAPPLKEVATEGLRVLRLLLPEVPLKTAVQLAAEITGEPRNHLYRQALALQDPPG
jgi:16S rRNA (cytidine1402-2'-O)-methyltransferase